MSITAGGRYSLTDNAATPYPATDLGKVSSNVTLKAPTAATGTVNASNWCIGVENLQGDTKTFKYSAQNGLEKGVCATLAAP